MATIVNARPTHLLMDAGPDRSKLYCPVCCLVSAKLQVLNVATRLPVERDPKIHETHAAFPGTKRAGKLPGNRRALSIELACNCGATFDLVLIPEDGKVRVAMLLGGG
jgi:hypothetical protein